MAVDAWKNHEQLKKMYSWHRVAEQTTKVFDSIMQQGQPSLLDRLKCYPSLEGFAGLVSVVSYHGIVAKYCCLVAASRTH